MKFTKSPFSFAPESDIKFFVGRNSELDLLTKGIIKNQEKLTAISGNNATGKTSLWRVFLEQNKQLLNDKVEVVYGNHFSSEFPDISNRIQLVIVEDLSFEFNNALEQKIQNYISKYPSKQFILVGAYKDKLEKFKPSSHIHLSPLRLNDSTSLLFSLVNREIPEKDINRITNLTKGNPFLIRLVSEYLNNNKYNLNQILGLISDNINLKGLILNNQDIVATSPEFKLITNDIKIVNQSILDSIRRNPNNVYDLSPRQFEEMVAELMTKRGYNVDLTKATRDGGKDLIIANHTDIGNFIYYVECKKFAPNRPVGVNLVRELAGTIHTDRVTAGLMITSSYFSPDAIQLSEKIKHQMELIDFVRLKEWIKNST
ncbi:restriction endonuclease [Maribacter halichondriae]|uniref:restriction endonuclease n=1 Tax=Maribacter halichondriae TaxID=2980554 RepID=UPI0023582820|nr:restriction endonuclease [Maribacter sp. Hal144]